jgi:hypothetical protein
MRVLFLVFFISCAALPAALDWPSSEAKQTANFGMNERGLPLLGMNFEASGDVFSADAGEIIFLASEQDSGRSIPNPLGEWVAIDHGEGLVGIYAKGDNIRENAALKKTGADTVLAKTGKTGWTVQNGFYFSIFDRKERRWVNPQIIAGQLPDTIPPVIQSVVLRGEGGQRIDLAQTRTIRQGRYAIEVQATDRAESAAGILAPYRIICSLNGVEVGILALEIFSARDGVLMIYGNGLVPVSQVYTSANALAAADDIRFTRGQASLEIIVQDFNRNTRRASYHLFIE